MKSNIAIGSGKSRTNFEVHVIPQLPSGVPADIIDTATLESYSRNAAKASRLIPTRLQVNAVVVEEPPETKVIAILLVSPMGDLQSAIEFNAELAEALIGVLDQFATLGVEVISLPNKGPLNLTIPNKVLGNLKAQISPQGTLRRTQLESLQETLGDQGVARLDLLSRVRSASAVRRAPIDDTYALRHPISCMGFRGLPPVDDTEA